MYRHGGRDNGRPSMVFGSIHSLMFIAWYFKTASTPHKSILVPLLSIIPLMVLELASLEKKKENDNFRSYQNSFSSLLAEIIICTQGFP